MATSCRFLRMLCWAAKQSAAMVIIMEKANAVQKCSPLMGVGGRLGNRDSETLLKSDRIKSGKKMNDRPARK